VRINGYNIFTVEDGVEFQWEHVYTYLKATSGKATISELREHFEGINESVLQEGIYEYNGMTKDSLGYFEPFKNNRGKLNYEY